MRGSPSGVALDFDYIRSEFDEEPIFQSIQILPGFPRARVEWGWDTGRLD